MVENRGKVAHDCITGYSFCTEIADHRRQEFVLTDLSYSITTAAALDLLTSYNSIKRKYRRTVSRLYMARARRRNLLISWWLQTIGASASVPDNGGSAGLCCRHLQRETESHPLPHLHAFLFPLTATTDLLISIHYVSASIYIYTPFQFPVHLQRCSESVREKDEEGPSRSSARSTATSLQIPR